MSLSVVNPKVLTLISLTVVPILLTEALGVRSETLCLLIHFIRILFMIVVNGWQWWFSKIIHRI